MNRYAIHRIARKAIVRIAVYAVLTAAGLYVAFFFAQTRMIFESSPVIERTPEEFGLDYENVRLRVLGEETHGWYVPLEEARGVVLLCHGNGGNMSTRLGSIRFFRSLGWSSMFFDYGGYGESTGKPSEKRVFADAMAVWQYLTSDRGVPPDRIVIWGRSFGGGAAADLASKVTPAGVVLESTYTSMPRAAFGDWAWLGDWFIRHDFDNLSKAGDFTAPLLVLHSRDDELYSIEHGHALYERAPGPKTFVELRGGHYHAWGISKKIYTKGVETFLDSVLSEPAPPSTP